MSVELRGNKLGHEGWGAIFAAICGNKDSKIMSLDASSEAMGPAGVKLIAEVLRTSITGGLTVTNLLGNYLDAESAKMLAEVAKQKGISLCGIQRNQTTADFSQQRDQTTAYFSIMSLQSPDAILLASDLSQAVVTGSLTSIDLSDNNLTDFGSDMTGIMELAAALSINGALTVANLRNNGLDAEYAKMLSEVAKQKGISLCGIQRHQTTADFSRQGLKPPDAILLASDLSQAGVTGSLTMTNLLGIELDAESAKMLAEVAKQKGISLCGIQRDQTTADFSNKNLKPPDAILLVSDLSQAGVTGSLTELSIYGNRVGDEGVRAICEAIQSNKETKLASLNFGNTGVGPVGANALAAMVAVTDSLTSVNVLSNNLDGEIADMLLKVKAEKPNHLRTLCGLTHEETELNFFNSGLGPGDAMLLAPEISVMGGLTVTNLLRSQLDAESAKNLAEVAKQKGISLCGIQRHQTTADFSRQGLKPPDAILLASDLSQAGVTGSLTVTNLLGNRLDAESANMLAKVVKQKGISLCGMQRDQTTADFSKKHLKPPDAILLASDLSQAGVTGSLTELSIYDRAVNRVGDEGVRVICEAIQSNKETKLASLNFGNNGIGPVGANALAAMVAVTGVLTVANLMGNGLDEESAKMLAEVAKQKGISLCGIQRDQTTADFSNQNLKPPDAILLASDLSQAGVTGLLTSLDLSNNELCGVTRWGRTYTAEGITAIADALRVTGSLTSLSLAMNELGDDGAEALSIGLKENKSLTTLDLSGKGWGEGHIGPRGATALASAISVNGSLTSVELRGNRLGDEGWGAIFAAICGNEDSKIMSMDASDENIGTAGVKLIAEALRTSVTGSLTKMWYVMPRTNSSEFGPS